MGDKPAVANTNSKAVCMTFVCVWGGGGGSHVQYEAEASTVFKLREIKHC
jgi:hypothetical protein